ncbi:MAG TPA: Xaa-Pro peptidase family protein [Candidatus Acidoferrales bacterium]|nr:Xaa-Pro peptidase family protein [Candidatus Acidoferrales bacterium]
MTTRTNKLIQSATKQSKPLNFAVFNPANLKYFANFAGATALLVTEQGEGTLYVSGTNYQQAKAEVKGFTVELVKRGETVMQKIAAQSPKTPLGIDNLGYESWMQLAKEVGSDRKLESAYQLFRELREVKDPEEIVLIRDACKMADAGIKAAAETIQVGATQKQVAAEAEYAMRKAGSDGVAFETIVSAGECCAFPHGTLFDKTINEGDFVTVDIGATNQFYCSDITRTFVAGKTSEKQQKIYETVQAAHQRAFDKIRAGIPAQKVDYSAWRVIDKAGYGDFFVHNLGHGVGLEVHEAPVLGPESKDVLQVGNVVTDEPGIYLPGYGGVRIEDTLLVTEKGAEKLTKSPYTP